MEIRQKLQYVSASATLGCALGSFVLSTREGIANSERFTLITGVGLLAIGVLLATSNYADVSRKIESVEDKWKKVNEILESQTKESDKSRIKDLKLLSPAESQPIRYKVHASTFCKTGAVVSASIGLFTLAFKSTNNQLLINCLTLQTISGLVCGMTTLYGNHKIDQLEQSFETKLLTIQQLLGQAHLSNKMRRMQLSITDSPMKRSKDQLPLMASKLDRIITVLNMNDDTDLKINTEQQDDSISSSNSDDEPSSPPVTQLFQEDSLESSSNSNRDTELN